jgi:hypothetical protein
MVSGAILIPFQSYDAVFGVHQFNGIAADDVSVVDNVHFQHGCCQTGGSFNLVTGCDIEAIPNVMMVFRDPKTQNKRG